MIKLRKDGKYELLVNLEFSTPSSCAVLSAGASYNGFKAFKLKSNINISLKEYLNPDIIKDKEIIRKENQVISFNIENVENKRINNFKNIFRNNKKVRTCDVFMGKFLQYDIDNIEPILKEFVKKISNEEYSNNELAGIYNQIKSYETTKTKAVFKNIIIRILFGIIEKGVQKSMNPFGLLLKKDSNNEKLIRELIYLDLYNNTAIFKIECDILSEYINRRGPITYSETDFKEFLILRVERILEASEELKDNISNAKNKMFRTIKNLKLLGVIKETSESSDTLYMGHYNPDWRIVALMIVNEFKSKKVLIEEIHKSKFKKSFFISEYDLNQILEKMNLKGIIKIESRAGLNQLNINISDPFELVESFQ